MRRPFITSIFASLVLSFAATTAAAANPPGWVDTWAAAPDSPGPALQAQTVRQVMRISVGGSHVRIRLSNLFGNAPLTVGPVHVALSAGGSSIVPGSDHPLLFNGKPTVTIAKGASAWSDSITMDVKPLQQLAISVYVPDHAAGNPSTIHNTGLATAYVTESGDATAATPFPSTETNGSRFLVTDIAVEGPDAKRTIVAFGDSITDGYASEPNANQRWPDYLAARLQADPAYASIGVANAGISGNRVLHEGAGPSALARFDRDALDTPGARWIVLLEGINDIGRAGEMQSPEDKVSAQQIIDGMKTLIARAHARHIKIYGATLTPYEGAQWPYHRSAGEKDRQAVNQWIRTSGAFDGVVDFDQAIRDPAHPARMLARYDSGDHLHPNGAGYEAMAKSIDLKLFTDTP